MRNKTKISKIISLLLLVTIHIVIAGIIPEDDINATLNLTELKACPVQEVDHKEQIVMLTNKYENPDIIGKLEILNTSYEAVITQSDDNSYYLNHTVDGKKSYMGNPFLDYRVDVDSSQKLLIYGHNSSKVDMPFKILENYYDEDYYNSHQYITLTTETGVHKYQIFSVYVETENWDYMDVEFPTKKSWLRHINELKSNSLYDTGTDLTEDDQILILQTCSKNKKYASYKKKYLLVISRRI